MGGKEVGVEELVEDDGSQLRRDAVKPKLGNFEDLEKQLARSWKNDEERSEALRAIADSIVRSLDGATILQMSVGQRGVLAGILYDKADKFAGKGVGAVMRHEHVHIHMDKERRKAVMKNITNLGDLPEGE